MLCEVDISIMESGAPDFSRYWLAGQAADASASSAGARDDEPLSPSLQEALEALAERINAARSIV
jgi:hypothetical protein